MAEQTYNLTQTGAEVQAIINDAENCKGAGAQTTLTDESVLLKDTNGQYHKILKSSFTEAIRDTLAGLLVNNDKGTTINQIAAIASGDFGSVTPANLASVLGANFPLGQLSSGTDANNLNTPGSYLCRGGVSNLPSTAWGVLMVVKMEEVILQVFAYRDTAQYSRLFFRTSSPAGFPTVWGDWKEFSTASFLNSYSDLSSLASALGVFTGDLGGDGTTDVIDSAEAYWSSMPTTAFASGYMNGNFAAWVMIWKHAGFGRIELRYRGSGDLEIYNKSSQSGGWTKLQ